MNKIIPIGIAILAIMLVSGCVEQKVVRQDDCPYNITWENGSCVYSGILNMTNETLELYAMNDSGLRSVTWDYNYAGKIWKYWTIVNATCHQVECECAKNTSTPCMAYCMECEELK